MNMHNSHQWQVSTKEARLLGIAQSPDQAEPQQPQNPGEGRDRIDPRDSVDTQVAKATFQGREAERIDENVVKNLAARIQEEVDEIYNDPSLNDGQKHDRVVQHVTDWNDSEVHHFGYHIQVVDGQVGYTKLDADSTYYQSPEVKQVAAEVQNAGKRLVNVIGVVGAENPGIIRGTPQYKYLYAVTKQRLQNEYNMLKQRLQMVKNGYSYQDAMNATGGPFENGRLNLNAQNNQQNGQQTDTGRINLTNNGTDTGTNTTVDDATEQQNILRRSEGLLKKWQDAKTQKDRDFAEGMLMMEGIDVDASDLNKGEMKVAPRESRSLTFFMGLLRAAKAFFAEKGADLPDDDGPKPETADKEPDELTKDERSAEIKDNETKLEGLKKQESDLTKEIEGIENAQAGKKSATGEEPSEEDTKKLEDKKKELENVKEEIKKLEARNEELKKDPEKDEKENLSPEQKLTKAKQVYEKLVETMDKSHDQIVQLAKENLSSVDAEKVTKVTEGIQKILKTLSVEVNGDEVRLTLDAKVLEDKAIKESGVSLPKFNVLFPEVRSDGTRSTKPIDFKKFIDTSATDSILGTLLKAAR